MRNWNYLWWYSHQDLQYGFYSTYEELKLQLLFHLANMQARFYSTYEELKQQWKI